MSKFNVIIFVFMISSLLISPIFANNPFHSFVVEANKQSSTGLSNGITSGLKPIGDFYDLLTQNNSVVDGLAVIFVAIGLYFIFFNLTRLAFKNEGAKSARKGASLMLSILVTGSLVVNIGEDHFVGYYGGIITFFMVLVAALATYIAYFKKISESFKDNKFLKLGLAALGLVIIDITLSSVAKKLFTAVNKGNGVPVLISWILNLLHNNMYLIIIIAVFGAIFGFLFKGNSSSSNDTVENPYITTDKDKKNINEIKGAMNNVLTNVQSINELNKKESDLLKATDKSLNSAIKSSKTSEGDGN